MIGNLPHELDETHTTAFHRLGYTYRTSAEYCLRYIAGLEADDGELEFIYVFNDEAATAFAKGDCIVQDTGADDPYHGLLSASATARAAHGTLGFAQWAIPFGEYGFILKKGVGYCKADDAGADQAADPLVPAGGTTVGGVDVMAAGEEHCVVAEGLADGGAAGTLFRARICCP